MKTTVIILSFCFIIISGFAQNKTSKFQVKYNKNLEVYFLAELLATDYNPDRTGKNLSGYANYRKEIRYSHSLYNPIANLAIETFKNDERCVKIAKLTATLNDAFADANIGNSSMMYPLVLQNEFPTNDYNIKTDYNFNDPRLSEAQNKNLDTLIKSYIQSLGEFYKEINFDDFLNKNQSFYNGAINEVYKNVAPKSFENIEKLYRESFLAYNVFVSPMFAIPIENNQSRGIAGFITTKKGISPFQVLAPFVKVVSNKKINEYKTFGYDYQPTIQYFTVHEFSHSFVNKEVEKYSERIQKSDSLFKKSILNNPEIMPTQGIQDWLTFIEESLVRVGELQVAKLDNDLKRYEFLKTEHHLKYKFILMPELEQKMKFYQGNRKKYPKYSDFMPELIAFFENNTIAEFNKKITELKAKTQTEIIGYTSNKDEIIFTFVLEKNQSYVNKVSVAGTFNNWNPKDEKFNFKKVTDLLYKLKVPKTNFEKGKVYPFKFVLNENQWITPPYSAKNILVDGGTVNLALIIE
jgi:hypothetical protein